MTTRDRLLLINHKTRQKIWCPEHHEWGIFLWKLLLYVKIFIDMKNPGKMFCWFWQQNFHEIIQSPDLFNKTKKSPPNSSGMSKTSKMRENIFWPQKGHVTFQGQGHVMSRSLTLILVADVRMHLCAKYDANRTIHFRVIRMAPERDKQTDRLTATLRSSQYRL